MVDKTNWPGRRRSMAGQYRTTDMQADRGDYRAPQPREETKTNVPRQDRTPDRSQRDRGNGEGQ